jgi:hypothetical protein
MGLFLSDPRFKELIEIGEEANDFLKNTSKKDLKHKLPTLRHTLNNITTLFIENFPLRRNLKDTAQEFKQFFEGNDILSYGLKYGWLENQMDLSYLNFYPDTPYHYRIGVGAHRGNGSIEEDFLLKDAFSVLVKAKLSHELLEEFGSKLKHDEEVSGTEGFSQVLYTQIADVKFDLSAYCRLSIISFYAFVEGFVNSVGFSHLTRHEKLLNEQEIELLKGLKNGRFLQLKSKVEKFQEIIRADKKIKLIVTDEKQIKESFKEFFDYYESLRNSAMHYSPMKETIWMRPKEWLDKAIEFSRLATIVSLEFWLACYPNSNGPEYLSKLDYDFHLNHALERNNRIELLKEEKKNWL